MSFYAGTAFGRRFRVYGSAFMVSDDEEDEDEDEDDDEDDNDDGGHHHDDVHIAAAGASVEHLLQKLTKSMLEEPCSNWIFHPCQVRRIGENSRSSAETIANRKSFWVR